jgi:hypothetical protein
VKSIIPGSAAYHNGQIQVNDKIVAVSNCTLLDFNGVEKERLIICMRGGWINVSFTRF